MTATILTVPDDLAGERLDRALAVLLPDLSRSRLKTLIEGGHVLLLTEAPEAEDDDPIDGATVTEPSSRVKPG